MQIKRQIWIFPAIWGAIAFSSASLPAQDSPLMAGLEHPYSQPVLQPLTDDVLSGELIQQQVHEVSSEFPVPITHNCQTCDQSGCTSSAVCAENCMQEKPWWRRKTDELNRKCYYNYHSYHPKALHPIVHPACQPGYGYYETCWRKITPNPCFCRPEYGPAMDNLQFNSEPSLAPPSATGEPLPPAPVYDR